MRRCRVFFLFLAFVNLSLASSAARAEDFYIPDQLRGWKTWVIDRHKELQCADAEGSRICYWPGVLQVRASESGATFSLTVNVDHRSMLALPGDSKNWPLNVRAGGQELVVTRELSGSPTLTLEPGSYEIQGEFLWKEMPDSLQLPSAYGLLGLNVDGRAVADPKVTSSNRLVFVRNTKVETKSVDALAIDVFRRLADGVPATIDTQIQLRVSGRAREVALGKVLVPGSELFQIVPPKTIDARYENDRGLVLQLRPGTYSVLLRAALPRLPETIEAPKVEHADWPAQEYWTWQENNQLRSVTFSGASAVDPERTSMPREWRSGAVYVVKAAEPLQFEVTRRGEENPAPSVFKLNRHYWLDLDGAGYTVADTINGTMRSQWRLSLASPLDLQSVEVNGKPQVITKDVESGLPGLELRDESMYLNAVARMGSRESTLPAVGWNEAVDSLHVSFSLPPGWELLHVSGVDDAGRTWFSSWTLFDFFLVLLVGVGVGKLYGLRWGALALAALVLGHNVNGAPTTIWFHLLAAVALLRVLPEGRFLRLVQTYRFLVMIVLAMMLVEFSFRQLELALFPQLELNPMFRGSSTVETFAKSVVNGPVSYQGGNYNDYQRVGGVISADAPMPATAPAPQAMEVYEPDNSQMSNEMKRKLYESVGKALSDAGAPAAVESFELKQEAAVPQPSDVDPNAVVQLGRVAPSWNWKTWELSWNGPVDSAATFSPVLIGPFSMGLLRLFRVVLMLLLAAIFFGWQKGTSLRSLGSAAALIAVILCANTQSAQAQDYPPESLLKELENRLLESRCMQNCSSISSLDLSIDGEVLTLRAEVSSRDLAAWKIPGPMRQFMPSAVVVDGSESTALRSDDRGWLWVRLPNGVHSVVVRGPIGNRDVVVLDFAGMLPGNVRADLSAEAAKKWSVEGISPSGAVAGSLQLTRAAEEAPSGAATAEGGSGSLRRQQVPNWFELNRTLSLGPTWNTFSRVTRSGDLMQSAHLEVPLLAGESLMSKEYEVKDGKVLLSFSPGQAQVSYASKLNEVTEMSMVAGKQDRISETWHVACAAMWRCNFSGLAPTERRENGRQSFRFDPWPGETVAVAVVKPQAVEGGSSAVQQVDLTFDPGQRILHGKLTFQLRATAAGVRVVTLPEGAEVEQYLVDGASRPIERRDRELRINFVPGLASYQIEWKQPRELGLAAGMPQVSIDSALYNVATVVNVPPNRWLLLTGGPSWGPAVLFWSKLLGILVAGVALGMIAFGPLKTRDWVLLGLGLSSIDMMLLIFFPLWIAALVWRERHPRQGRWAFNLLQLALIALTLIALSALFEAVQTGLLFLPDMQVHGNGSNDATLRWYTDAVSQQLPTPWFFSLPIWVYRGAMLVWSIWLVFALIRWLRWVWQAFNSGGYWRGKGDVQAAAN